MDAYSNLMIQLAEARLSELRREAAERSASRAAKAGRRRFAFRLRRGRSGVAVPVVLPTPAPEADLRRSA